MDPGSELMVIDRGYEKTAHLYDLFGRKPNVDFYHRYAAKTGEVLDVGAGTGLVAVPLAERGIKVWCVEPSTAMLTRFGKKLDMNPSLRELITLIPADARGFHIPRSFDVCFSSATFDHFLSDDERVASLSNIARHLESGGRFVFDVFFGYMKDEELAPAGEVREGEFTYKRYVGGKVKGQVKEYLLVFEKYRGGELEARIEQESAAGITDRKTILDVLARTGFEVVSEYCDYEFTPYNVGDKLFVVEALKRRKDNV